MTAAPNYQRRVDQADELEGVRHQLGRLRAPISDEDQSFNAVLAAGELLANCLVHIGQGCLIEAWLDHGPPPRLRDAGAGLRAMHATGDPRGLRIVDRVTSRWGVDSRLEGKVVWFEIRSPSVVPEPMTAEASANGSYCLVVDLGGFGRYCCPCSPSPPSVLSAPGPLGTFAPSDAVPRIALGRHVASQPVVVAS